jgi:hypothetical protein
MARIFRDAPDEAYEELLLHCRTVASLCLKTAPASGPFNAPVCAFVDGDMNLEPWHVLHHHRGSTYAELIQIIRLEAMTRSVAGLIEGAALMMELASDGRKAVGIQIHTRQSSKMLVFPVGHDGVSLGEPEEASLYLSEGLCFFGAGR